MLEEQVLFYISGKGSARYRVTSKLVLSVGCFLQNCKRLKYKVALHEPASLGHKVQREQLDLPCHRRCRQAGGQLPCSHGTHGPACGAGRGRAQLRDGSRGAGSTSRSQAETSAPTHPSCTQLTVSLCKTSTQASTPAALKNAQKRGRGQ